KKAPSSQRGGSKPPAKDTKPTVKRARREEGVSGKGEYFRAVALPYRIAPGYEDHEVEGDEELYEGGKGITVYLDPDVVENGAFRDNPYATVQVVNPPGLAPPQDMAQQQGQAEGGENGGAGGDKGSIPPATRIVAKIGKWN